MVDNDVSKVEMNVDGLLQCMLSTRFTATSYIIHHHIMTSTYPMVTIVVGGIT